MATLVSLGLWTLGDCIAVSFLIESGRQVDILLYFIWFIGPLLMGFLPWLMVDSIVTFFRLPYPGLMMFLGVYFAFLAVVGLAETVNPMARFAEMGYWFRRATSLALSSLYFWFLLELLDCTGDDLDLDE